MRFVTIECCEVQRIRGDRDCWCAPDGIAAGECVFFVHVHVHVHGHSHAMVSLWTPQQALQHFERHRGSPRRHFGDQKPPPPGGVEKHGRTRNRASREDSWKQSSPLPLVGGQSQVPVSRVEGSGTDPVPGRKRAQGKVTEQGVEGGPEQGMKVGKWVAEGVQDVEKVARGLSGEEAQGNEEAEDEGMDDDVELDVVMVDSSEQSRGTPREGGGAAEDMMESSPWRMPGLDGEDDSAEDFEVSAGDVVMKSPSEDDDSSLVIQQFIQTVLSPSPMSKLHLDRTARNGALGDRVSLSMSMLHEGEDLSSSCGTTAATASPPAGSTDAPSFSLWSPPLRPEEATVHHRMQARQYLLEKQEQGAAEESVIADRFLLSLQKARKHSEDASQDGLGEVGEPSSVDARRLALFQKWEHEKRRLESALNQRLLLELEKLEEQEKEEGMHQWQSSVPWFPKSP